MASLINSFQRLVAVTASRDLRSESTDESGQTFVEYAMILAVLAIGAVAALILLDSRIADLYSTVNASVGSVL